MNVYVPAAFAPPARRWQQKLSVAVVIGSGLAMAALAISKFEQADEAPQRPKAPPTQVPRSDPGFTSLAPPPVSSTSVAPQPVAPAPTQELVAPPAVAPPGRTQLMFVELLPKVEPTVRPRAPSYRPPPSSFMPPILSSEAPVGFRAPAALSQDLPSNMTALAEGVYQVASGAPAEEQTATDTASSAEPASIGPAEVPAPVPMNALRVDDHGTLQDQGETCVPDQAVHTQNPEQAPAAPTVSAAAANSAVRRPDDPQVRAAPAAAAPNVGGQVGATAPEVAQAPEVRAQPNTTNSSGGSTAMASATDPLAAGSVAAQDSASASAAPAQANAPTPCKVGIQVEGRPTVEMPIFLVRREDPAVRLASLLELVRADLPATEFERLRGSMSAETILSVRDLVAAGFAFQVIDGNIALSVAS